MGDPEKEPLCTVKELLAFGVICVVYCSIFFSMDPDWVAWAAPLVFGGSLYAADPPPASAHLDLPLHVFPTAYLFYVLSLLCIVLLTSIRDRQSSAGNGGSTPESEIGRIAQVRRFLRSSFALMARH
ncbi:MAG: hypothetical protein WCF61_13765 [Terriglobales bacterium]